MSPRATSRGRSSRSREGPVLERRSSERAGLLREGIGGRPTRAPGLDLVACHTDRCTRFHGVTRHPTGLWIATISRWPRKGRCLALGAFENATDAALRHDRVARFLGRGPEELNFPGDQSPTLDPKRVLVELRLQPQGAPTSPYAGVSRASYGRLWCAELASGATARWLGVWPSELAAAIAVDRARLYYEGAGAWLNLRYPRGAPTPADSSALEQESLAARARPRPAVGPLSERAPLAAHTPPDGALHTSAAGCSPSAADSSCS